MPGRTGDNLALLAYPVGLDLGPLIKSQRANGPTTRVLRKTVFNCEPCNPLVTLKFKSCVSFPKIYRRNSQPTGGPATVPERTTFQHQGTVAKLGGDLSLLVALSLRKN